VVPKQVAELDITQKTIIAESGGGAETDKCSAETDKSSAKTTKLLGRKKIAKPLTTKHSMREIVRLTGNGFSIVFMMIEQFKNAQFEELIKK
jgi:hypothetical protein